MPGFPTVAQVVPMQDFADTYEDIGDAMLGQGVQARPECREAPHGRVMLLWDNVSLSCLSDHVPGLPGPA